MCVLWKCLYLCPDPPSDWESPHLSRLSGVTVHPDEINDPKMKVNVEEAVKKIKDNKDILGEVEQLTSSACWDGFQSGFVVIKNNRVLKKDMSFI